MTKLKVMIALVAVGMFLGYRAWQDGTKLVVASLTSCFASQATLTQSSFREAKPVPAPKVAAGKAPARKVTTPARVFTPPSRTISFEQECSFQFEPRQGHVVFILTNPEPGVVSLGG